MGRVAKQRSRSNPAGNKKRRPSAGECDNWQSDLAMAAQISAAGLAPSRSLESAVATESSSRNLYGDRLEQGWLGRIGLGEVHNLP
jgi:hypothetical protein